ncbi:MAG: DUF1598 domain-containing protein [Fuerstiella sp.]|nr:DUF1598 domain-containing protein [Fuerstiella sp.]
MVCPSTCCRSIVRFSAALVLVCILSFAAVAHPAEQSDNFTATATMRRAARAAAEAGDFVRAASNIRDASRVSGNRDVEKRAARIAESLSGGGSLADFTELIELIQEQTSPPALWIEADGEGGTISTFAQGIFVGGPAMLASVALRNDGSRLDTVMSEALRANQNTNVRSPSNLRLVSLPRLERYVSELLATGQPVPEEVRNLAGISRVQYLMTFPETGDVVIGGPAADWTENEDGRVVSITDGRPVLQLDDLMILAQTFSDGGPSFFMCSIDPRQDQVRAVNEFVRKNRRSLNKETAARFTTELEQILGLQNVIVDGVPGQSRVARVIVDADYRMKQIGIGEVVGAAGMKSYFDLLTKSEQRGSGSMDALRWWLAAGYDAIRMDTSGNGFEFTGDSVRCLSEDQIVNTDGSRRATGKARGANARFAQLFTEHFSALARIDPVFADLQNVFDLAMVSALLNSQGTASLANLESDAFLAATGRQVDVPSELMTSAAHRVFSGRHVVVQVAGGVRADVRSVVRDADRYQHSAELSNTLTDASPIGHRSDAWWWDAAR